MKKKSYLLGVLAMCSSAWATDGLIIFSEKFNTDPFGNGDKRFEQTLEQYGFMWLAAGADFRPEINGPGNPNGPAVNLPLSSDHVLYAFSQGNITLRSLDERPLPDSYIESIDFEISGDKRFADIMIGFGVARSIYISENNVVGRMNANKEINDSITEALTVDESYELSSSVIIHGDSAQTGLQIIRKSDNRIIVQWELETIPIENLNRRQLKLSLPGTDGRYWSQTVMIDNWQIVTSEKK